MRRKIKKQLKDIAFAILALTVIIWGLFDYNIRVDMYLKEIACGSIKKSAEFSAAYIQNKVADTMNDLNQAAKRIAAEDDGKNNIILELLWNMREFEHVYLLDKDGNGTNADGIPIDLADHDAYKDAVKGKEVVSDQPIAESEHGTLTFFIPVWRNGIVDQIIAADYSREIMQGFLEYQTYWGEEGNLLVRKDGYIVASLQAKSSNNVFDLFAENATFTGSHSIIDVRNGIESGKSGAYQCDIAGSAMYGYYIPIQLNSWYLVCGVNKSAITADAEVLRSNGYAQTAKVACCLFVLGIIYYCSHRRAAKLIMEGERKWNALVHNIPGTVLICKDDHAMTMKYIGENLHDITQFEKRDILERFNNSYTSMIYEEDGKKACQEIQVQLLEEQAFTSEFRIARKDGELLWMQCQGQLVQEDGISEIYIVQIDITKLKEMMTELELSRKRFDAIMEKTDSVIYEWDMVEDIVSYSEVWGKKFGYATTDYHFLESIAKRDMVHKDDVNTYLELIHKIYIGDSPGECVVRIKNIHNVYIWCRIHMMILEDASQKERRTMGFVIDIDRERRTTEGMMLKAQRDSLTQLYNKGTTNELIESYLCLRDVTEGLSSCIIIDVDDFKSVNDTYGHLVGDEVLKKIALAINNVFRSNDIQGRIGGDEFLVLLKKVPNVDKIIEKVSDFFLEVETMCKDSSKFGEITCSVGISIYPNDGDCFALLYEKADLALYYSKSKGKNAYTIYQDINESL